MSHAGMSNCYVDFGKYGDSNVTYRELLSVDPDYCKWMVTEAEKGTSGCERFKRLAAWLTQEQVLEQERAMWGNQMETEDQEWYPEGDDLL